MHVLITRPERDCADLTSRIAALGCELSVGPLLDIAFEEIQPDALSSASSLIATSRNGLRALAVSPGLDGARALPLYVVGPATASLARDLGFQQIREGAGTAADLVPLICNAGPAERRHLVHLAGDHLAFDLAGALNDTGIRVTTLPAYRSVAAKTLPPKVIALLATRTLDAVVLMSPRSALVWASLVLALPLKVDLTKVVHVCMSPAVAHAAAESLQSAGAILIETAVRPTTEEIVALVYRLAGRAKTG